MISVLPSPKNIMTSKEFGLCKFEISSKDLSFNECINGFKQIATQIFGKTFTDGENGLVIRKNETVKIDGYNLKFEKEQIVISVSSSEGLGYAFATILQVVKTGKDYLKYPVCEIEDFPDCKYRGLMVDVARQYHSIEELLGYVNICFLYKIKYLHIHFIDDQAYTLPSHVLENISSDNHYTFEEIKMLVNYAHERNVRVVPEIETIGHSICFLDKYPEIFDLRPIDGKVYDGFSINDVAKRNNVVCAGSMEVREYMKAFIDEIISMFPYSEYIHIGGDEASICALDTCSVCVEYMKNNNLSSSNELFGEYLGFLTKYVISKGKTPLVWEGFSKEIAHFISKETLVIAWESYYNLSPDLLADGFKIINCSWKPLYITPYLSWTIKDIRKWNIYSWRHWWKKSKAYGKGIDIPENENVLGGQLCSWECNYGQEYQKIKKNLLALSERTWNNKQVFPSLKNKTQKLYGLVSLLNNDK